jgi:hypothetical protein
MMHAALGVLAIIVLCVLIVSAAPHAQTIEMVGLVVVVSIVGYGLLSIFTLRRLWRLAARISSVWLRIPLQAAAFALLFSPTFLACGAFGPVPYPFILAIDVLSPPSSACGNLSVLTSFNTQWVVLPTWLLFTVSYSLRIYWPSRHAL